MTFTAITPVGTLAGQLRAVLKASVEQQGALQTVTQLPPGVTVTTTTTIDYQKQVDEVLAALFNFLAANTSGATQTAVNNFRTQVGV